MPFPNEHACRVRNPGDFQKGSFRRIKGGSRGGKGPRDGKALSIIIGRLKGKTTTTTQSYCYPIDAWTAAQARGHCREQKGSFEAAQPKKEADVTEESVDYVVEAEEEQTEKAYGEAMFSSATSFNELEAHEQAQEAAQEVRSKAAQFQMLVNNIMSNPDVDDKAAALGALAIEFTSKVGEAMNEAKEVNEVSDDFMCYVFPDGSDDAGKELTKELGEDMQFKFVSSPRNKYGTHSSFGFKGSYAKAWRVHFSKVGGGAATGKATGPIRGTVRRTEMIAAAMKPKCSLPGTENIGARGGAKSPLPGSFPKGPGDYGLSSWTKPENEQQREGIKLSCKDLAVIKRAALGEIKKRQQDAGKELGLMDRLINAVKSVFEGEPDRKPGFTVWKEADGTYRWFAVFSNKYRDRDNPPEILSDAAHKEFVAAVDTGDWPMPKLWLWHVKGSESGYADWLAYDEENGFNCASGVVADEQVAKNLASMGDLLVSHGMPVEHIQRDSTDPTIITGYRSVEISPLPSWAAANELTDFALLKEADMAIPEEKKDFLRQAGLSDEQIASIEDGLKQKADEAKEQELEFKDTGEEEQAESEEQVTESTEAKPAGSGEVEDSPLTRDEVVEAIAAAFQPLQQQLEAVILAQAEQAKALKELVKTDDEKVAEKATLTPAASLAELVAQRVIGSPEARIDGRKKLAKSGPKETEPTEPGLNPTPVNFINQLLAAGQTVN